MVFECVSLGKLSLDSLQEFLSGLVSAQKKRMGRAE